ncbi:MAG: tetratricopeptide repeat protein [Planctomycetota bacterium]
MIPRRAHLVGLGLVLAILGQGWAVRVRNADWSGADRMAGRMLAAGTGKSRALCQLAETAGAAQGPRAGLELLESAAHAGIPRDDNWHLTAGRLRLGLNDLAGAERSFDAVGAGATLRPRADVYLGRIKRYAGDDTAAQVWFRRAATADPRNWEAWYEIARVHADRQETALARAAIEQAAAVYPHGYTINRLAATLYAGEARALKAAGQPGAARELFVRAASCLERIAPERRGQTDVQLWHIDLLFEAHHVKPALNALKELHGRLPHDAQVLHAYGFASQEYLLYKRAEDLFRELAAVVPDDPDTQYWLAGLLFMRGRIQEAAGLFEAVGPRYAAAGITTRVPDIMNNLALIDMRLGDLAAAEVKFKRVLEDTPGFWQARAGLAEVHILRHDAARAREAVTILRGMVPASYFALIRLEGMLAMEERYQHDLARYRDQ